MEIFFFEEREFYRLNQWLMPKEPLNLRREQAAKIQFSEDMIFSVLAVEDRGEYKKARLRNHKRIHVEEKTFKLWLQEKFDAGYESFSDSDLCDREIK